MKSYKGMCTAFAAESSIDWKGFVYTFSIEPNERLLLDKEVPLYSLGMFRQYLASSIQVVPVGFSAYEDVSEKLVLSEHRRITQEGYFNQNDSIDHLGRRGKGDGFLKITSRSASSNLDWFKGQYPEERWEKLVEQSSQIARKKARERFQKESNLSGAKEMIAQILSMQESHANYYGTTDKNTITSMKRQYDILLESLMKPIIRLESASFIWLLKK